MYLPSRPNEVYLTGAINNPGLHNLKAGDMSIMGFVNIVSRQHANNNWVWLIQPDSNIRKVGVAKWNQEPKILAAPGAIILVPFASKLLAGIEPDFNKRLAEFLATQNVYWVQGL